MKADCNIDEYIKFTQMLIKKYGRYYLKYFSYPELLSYAYEAMLIARRSFSGKGSIRGWINLKVRLALKQCARDGDLITRYHRNDIKKGLAEEIEILSADSDEVTLSSNGYAIKRFEDHQFIERLIKKAKLSERSKKRLRKYYLEGFSLKEIAANEGRGVAAISLSNIVAIKKMKNYV